MHGWDKSEVMYTTTKRADDEEQLKQINIRTEQRGPSVSIIATADDQDGSVALVFMCRDARHCTSRRAMVGLISKVSPAISHAHC
jgi:hypothetical protein